MVKDKIDCRVFEKSPEYQSLNKIMRAFPFSFCPQAEDKTRPLLLRPLSTVPVVLIKTTLNHTVVEFATAVGRTVDLLFKGL